MTAENVEGQPLGYCIKCDRVRWIAVLTPGKRPTETPTGICRSCAREGDDLLLGPDSSENFGAVL